MRHSVLGPKVRKLKVQKAKVRGLLVLLAGLICCITLSCRSTGSAPESRMDAEPDVEEEAQQTADDYFEFPPVDAALPVSSFGETWGYLIAGEESALNARLPLSDVVYHSANINSYGKLRGVPNPKNAPRFGGRLHMDVMCDSMTLTHFVLMPGSKERQELIADLLEAAKNFDGLQIDFENIPDRDGAAFLSFLAELRAGLKDKMFTIALKARMRTISNDVYDYAKIKPLVDRILVMAYDEHWSTSAPGPIASMDFCKKVAEHSLRTIGPEKLIMGVPFYGRTWGNVKLINWNRAFYYTGIERIKRENNVTEVRRVGGIPTFNFTFTYQVPITVTGYYDDEYSLSARLEMYRTMGVKSVGFWRIGQETPAIWKLLKLDAK